MLRGTGVRNCSAEKTINRREEAGTGCVGLEVELLLQTYVSNRDISL